jgi:hypothetical protein
MATFTRRVLFAGVLAFGVTELTSRQLQAAVFRALTLEALVRASDRVVVVVPLGAESHYDDFRGARHIVTDTRVRIEQTLRGRDAASSECFVRTLGGIVGDEGELVSGQAELRRSQPALTFLVDAARDVSFVAGMAQGHYPLVANRRGLPRLVPSPRLGRFLPSQSTSAADRLVGRSLEEARRLLQGISK